MSHSPAVVALALALALAVGLLVIRPVAFAYTRPEDDPVPDATCPHCSAAVLGKGATPGAYMALVLRRRCAACGSVGPDGTAQRPGPPLLAPEGLAVVGTAAMLAAGANGVVLAAQLWLVAVGAVLVLTDFAVHRMPDHLTAAAGIGVGFLLTASAFASGRWGPLLLAAVAAFGLGFMYFVLALFGQGLGDAKLVPGLAALVTWQYWFGSFYAVFLACVLGIVQWIVMKVAFPATTRKTELMLGPALITGFLTVSACLG
ncbi:prepilin peptidase [Kitasatospora sp. NPDC048296]|uniref:prepilin peptidase n=1 Tax=Kitasatospora sp. NPDC048296 TaxID=3364048 RepID=UPI00372019B6